MATARALLRLLTATISPGKTWLPLNATTDANDRGDTPSSYRARALADWRSPRDATLEVPPECMLNACEVAAFGRDVLLSGSESLVLRRWLGFTPERPHST